jgi:hypothetical protein
VATNFWSHQRLRARPSHAVAPATSANIGRAQTDKLVEAAVTAYEAPEDATRSLSGISLL